MKIISTKTHGIIDYVVGLLLIAAPWILDFARGGAETWVPVVLGAGTIVYSLMTDYELGAFRMLSMRTHLAIDLVAGFFLALSPWIFGFADYVWAPHVIVGVMELVAVALSSSVTSTERRHDNTRGFTAAH
jgi:SPW repeat-containing protein